MYSIKGKIITPDKTIQGTVVVEDGKIVRVAENNTPTVGEEYNFGQALVVPGFIDLHLHGLGEFEATDKANLVGMAKLEPQFGTTSFLPTGAAMTVEQYVTLGKSARQAKETVNGFGAKIQGVHLEGPFINPKSSGAMALPTRRPIDLSEASIYVDEIGDFLKIMTLSPELEAGVELIKYLCSNRIVVSLGHSVAGADQLHSFVDAGLTHVAHMFNSFVPSGEKEPGVLKAGLIEHIMVNDALTCEFICDMYHVTPAHITIASRVLGPDRFIAITDSLFGAGLEDGVYQLPDGVKYRIADGVSRLLEGQHAGCLAGSVLTMNRVFGNLIEHCGIDPVIAAKYTATNAARIIGIEKETGSIEPGKCADIAVLDKDYQCIATFIDGKMVYAK